MPIIVKDYTWKQTLYSVTIVVPLRGTHSSKVDVFTSKRYIKLSYSPFFFDVLLSEEIDNLKSLCTFTDGHATLELTKLEPVQWEQLENQSLSRHEKNAIKNHCVQEECENIQKRSKEKVGKHHELKRVAVREAIKQDTAERDLVYKIRSEEKHNALGNIQEWREQLEDNSLENNEDNNSSSDDSDVEECTSVKIVEVTKEYKPINSNNTKQSVIVEKPIRKAETVFVTFTKRELPTPCRESRLEEENEWLKGQALARRSVGFEGSDLKPEEKNPLFVKCKGDEFLKQGNYLGAISAYTFGIQLSPKFVDLYLGRLEAQFELKNYSNCAKDCSAALELMIPEVPANLKQRIQCIYRRGVSIFYLGFKDQGTNEVRAAIRLDPTNEEMKNELERLFDIIDDEED